MGYYQKSYVGITFVFFGYNGITYYYLKNLQEDIIGIMDSNYNVIVSYQYDAYGKIISIKDNNGNEITDSNHIAYINPFRYRSYCYDNETKLYYLNSRYYSPEFGRFLNANNDKRIICNPVNSAKKIVIEARVGASFRGTVQIETVKI